VSRCSPNLWDCDCAYTNISKGQREKEVHCGVETRVRADGQNYEISQNANQVYGQEQAEEEGLQFWIICQSQKKEFGDSSFVSGFHVVDDVDGKAKVDTTKSATVRRC
jgi:hypothetical protein